jgi:hypothetical protein
VAQQRNRPPDHENESIATGIAAMVLAGALR